MKITEFRNLIREEVRKVLSEDRYSDIARTIKFNPAKIVKYKVGAGQREGSPVLIKDLKQVIGKALKTIETIEKYGVTFDKAYANIRSIGKSYMGTGSGQTLTYTLFGKDSSGNEIIYDKYEGATAGGGQAFVFVNGKKEQASQYIYELEQNDTK